MLMLARVLLAMLLVTACSGGEASVDVRPVASEPPSAPSGGTSLTIVLDLNGPEGEGSTRTFTLTCDPAGGDHPDPAAACAALEAAGGASAFEPVPKDVACTEIYGGPQTAQVTGTVGGTTVDAVFSRVNGCEIGRWDALAPLLASAGGG